MFAFLVLAVDDRNCVRLRPATHTTTEAASHPEHVLLAPYPGMKTRIALTAWTRLDAFDAFDESRINRFIKAYQGIDHHKQ